MRIRHEPPRRSATDVGEPSDDQVGRAVAVDADGREAASISYRRFPDEHVVHLGAATGLERGEAGRALLDALDRAYPPPQWILVADATGHPPEVVGLFRSRRTPGRQWVHVDGCEELDPTGCTCEFPD